MGAGQFDGVGNDALLSRVMSTTVASERNALAIELADRGEQRAIPALLVLVERHRGANGSLIYALQEFGPAAIAGYPWALMRRIASDEAESFEARGEARKLIDDLIAG